MLHYRSYLRESVIVRSPSLDATCPDCGRQRLWMFKPKAPGKHPCDRKCLYAWVPVCLCDCGGANHGKGLWLDHD